MDGLRSHSEGGGEPDPVRPAPGGSVNPYGEEREPHGPAPGGEGANSGGSAESAEFASEATPLPADPARDEPGSRPADSAPGAEAPTAFGRQPELGRRKLDPRAIPASRLANGIGNLVFAILLFVGSLVLRFVVEVPDWLEPFVIPAAVVVGLFTIFFTHFWIGVALRRVRYRVDPRGMEIVRGVLFRSVVAIPRSRVQHTDVTQGPVQRRYGIATLSMYTAGTQNSSVEITGLAHETALEIRDYFMADSGSDDAV